MANTQEKIAKGIFVKHPSNVIYVFGRAGADYTKGISTGMTKTKANITYVKKNRDTLLVKLIAEKKGINLRLDEPTVSEYGLEVLNRGDKKEDNKGRVGKRGRNEKNQRDVVLKFEKHIKPYFKNAPLSSITTTMVNEWLDEKLTTLSPSTVTKLRTILHRVYYEAIGEELVSRNPVEYAERFENYSEKREIYSTSEVSTIFKHAKGFLQLYLSLIGIRGVRPAEAHGLLRDDFDLEKGVLYLNRSLSTHVSTNEDDPQLEFLKFKFGTKKVLTYRDSTKNHNRVIVLTPNILNLVKEHIEQMGSTQLFLFVGKKTKEPFTATKNIIKNYFKPLLEEIGVEYIDLYALRHAMVTASRAVGINEASLKQTIGHSQGSDVTNRYDHKLVTDKWIEVQREDAVRVEEFIREGK